MKLTHDSEKNVWHFETEELSGFIQPEGARHGVKQLLHKPTGVQVVHPKYDALNLFLQFSTNLCMGSAREKARTVRATDATLEVRWPPTDDHRVEMVARYAVKEPNIIDLTITVRPQWPYPAYELFLSNYFDTSLRPHVFVQGCPYTNPPNQPQWTAPEVNDVYLGTGLVFPRDPHAARLSVDGRWARLKAKVLYQWNPQRFYEKPVVFQADPARRVAAVLMSRPEDCFAVVTGYHSQNPNDPFAAQNPMYLSLFGDDLMPGQERTVRTRLAVTRLDGDLSRPLALYDTFVRG
ncbi:MAG: hypothetical protein FJ278_17530 [Planctomycetes bacterium]|nr:hypothetical protein [Planctomycetota bacterium]